MSVQFEDINTYDGQTAYAVVNESVSTWRRVLDAMPNVDTAGAVCSGGEVAFYAIAPKVRKALTLIDHAYGSLYFACGKYHLIAELGSVKAYEALVKNDRETLKPFFEAANKDLPTTPPEEEPKEHREYREAEAAWQQAHATFGKEWNEKNPRPHYSKGWRAEDDWYRAYDAAYRKFAKDNPRPKIPAGYPRNIINFDTWWRGGDGIYKHIPSKAVAEFRAKRNKITFCHGDLTDLEAKGPFDFVYFSNALPFSGRKDRPEMDVKKLVTPGGFVAFTGHAYERVSLSSDPFGSYNKPQKRKYGYGMADFEEVVGIRPGQGGTPHAPDATMGWEYTLLRRPA